MMRTSLVGVAACLLLVGCSGLDTPRAEVVSIQPGAVSDEGGVVDFTVLLMNPNDVELPVKKVSYTVALGDETFTFDATPAVSMPVYGQQTFTLPAAFPTGGGALPGKPVNVSGMIYYQPPGKVREALSDMKIPLPHVSFESSATLE